MSTYDSPYVYGELPGTLATAAARAQQLTLIKNWFIEAGWDVTSIPHLLRINTSGTEPTFGPCDLGASNDVFWQVTKSTQTATRMMIYSDSSCFTDGPDTEDINWKIPAGLIDNVLTYTPEMEEITTYLDSSSGSGYKAYQIGTTKDDRAGVHDKAWKMAMLLIGGEGIYYKTISDGSGGYYAYIGIELDTPLDYTIGYGGQLGISSTNLGGSGFIARSASNIVDGNYAEVYVYYENSNGSGGAGSFNRLRFRMRVGARFLDDFTTHPLIICGNEEDINVSHLGGLAEEYDIVGYIGPYTFFLDQPSLGTSNCTAWGGAFRIKRLDGETGEPNIKKAIMMGVTGSAIAHNADSFRTSFSPVINMCSWIKTAAQEQAACTNPGTVGMCGYSSSQGLSIQRNGIMWYNDIAPVSEPWIGWPIFDDFGQTANTDCPLFCQIPNAIVPFRSIALGEPPSPDEIFVFDRNRLFRYYQNNRYPTIGIVSVGPGSSMAFVVNDPRIFNGTGYSGLELYQIKSVSISPTEVSANGTAIVTITAADAQDLSNGGVVFVRANNGRVALDTYIVEFAPDSPTATVDLTENGLLIEETVRLEILGKNNTITNFSFTALAV